MNSFVSGTPAFVLGNGPTLPVASLSILQNCFTVGVNRILKAGFVPTVLLWCDSSVWRENSEIDECGALLVCDKSVAQRQFHIGLPTVVGDAALSRQPSPHELNLNGNTGCCAARWAACLGFWPVYLVGMSATYKNGQTDFYGDNRWHHKGEGGETATTLTLMRSELTRLRYDCGDAIREIEDGEMLEWAAKRSPTVDQDAIRARLRAYLTQTPG